MCRNASQSCTSAFTLSILRLTRTGALPDAAVEEPGVKALLGLGQLIGTYLAERDPLEDPEVVEAIDAGREDDEEVGGLTGRSCKGVREVGRDNQQVALVSVDDAVADQNLGLTRECVEQLGAARVVMGPGAVDTLGEGDPHDAEGAASVAAVCQQPDSDEGRMPEGFGIASPYDDGLIGRWLRCSHGDCVMSRPRGPICVRYTQSRPAVTPGSHAAMERRKPGPEPRFTREELAHRALAIMDEHGTEGLTMGRLAGELGMGTMALYRYFPSKDALMDAAIDVAARDIELPDPGAAPWRKELASLARALFRASMRHPVLARERFNRPLQSSGAMRVTNSAIELLLIAGLTKKDAVAAFKALLVHTMGAAAFAASESRADVRQTASSHHESVAAEELPAMAAVATQLTAALGGDEAFEFGLNALLDGIEMSGEGKRRRQARRPPGGAGDTGRDGES